MTEPEQIRTEVDALLAQLPDAEAGGSDVDLDAVAARLEDAHDVLVRALEAVEQPAAGEAGSAASPDGTGTTLGDES
jgi:hypothetical protein